MFPPVAKVLPKFLVAVLVVATVWEPARARPPRRDGGHRFQRCWQVDLGASLAGKVAIDGRSAFVPIEPAAVRAFDTKNGQILWSSELGGSLISNLSASKENVFVVSGSTENGANRYPSLKALSSQTGITNWALRLPEARSFWLGVDGDMLVAVADTGLITGVSMRSRSVKWSTAAGGLVAEPAIRGGEILVDATGGKTFSFETSDGRQTAELATKFEPTAISYLFGNKIGIGDGRGNISLFEPDNESPKWMQKNGARIASLQMTEYGALAASYDNFISMLAANGNVAWKRRLPARPSIRPAIVGEIALAVSGGPEIYVIDLEDGKLLDKIELADAVADIAAGADGRSYTAADSSGTVNYYSLDGCQ